MKAPVLLKERLKILVGYRHVSEYFDFTNIGTDFDYAFEGLNNRRLKNNALSVIVSHSINATSYFAGRFQYGSAGDYKKFMDFDQRYAVYKLVGIYAFKPHDDFEWGIGLGLSKSFRRTGALPLVLLNKNFSKKWGMEAVLPGRIFFRNNVNDRNLLIYGIEYNSDSYRLDIEDDVNALEYAYAYNHSEVIASARLETQIAKWVWVYLKTGYQFNFASEFEAKNIQTLDFTANPTGAPFFRVGLFLAPPRKNIAQTSSKI